jgi:hypothetical protein
MVLDLKPLSKEVIQKMAYNPHDLWVVKINDEVFGPFEIKSLTDYAKENSQVFKEALASRIDTNDWHPFYSHASFQEIILNSHESEEVPSRFWILNLGQKVGPLSKMDIEKKLELNILISNDLISLDDGHNWQKIYQVEDFNQHLGGAESLPLIPSEPSFTRSRQQVNDWLINNQKKAPHQSLADMAYLGQKDKTPLNLEEIDIKSLDETEMSRSLKWALPTAVAAIVTLVMVGGYLMSPSDQKDIVENDKSTEENRDFPKKVSIQMPNQQPAQVNRNPANYNIIDNNQRSALTQAQAPVFQNEPFQSHTELRYNEPDTGMDPGPEADQNPPTDQPQEHSLVSNNLPGGNDNSESLDQSMSPPPGEQAPEQPVIEEASDF